MSTPGPPNRPIRNIEDDLWEAFGASVGHRQRSAAIRQYIRWHLRIPGADLPERPTAGRWTYQQDTTTTTTD